MSSSNKKLSVSFVIPCLNEAETLGMVLEKINQVRQGELSDIETEIVVSDNGSTDDSAKIAESHGARVVPCEERGYGAALINGIEAATCEAVIFADADNTYDFLESPKLIERLNEGFELVVGSRMDGTIHKGAMPFMHHYVGTPVLNFFLNLLYAKKDNRISDCNSGFRCFLRASFFKWEIHSKGMEFASEMLVKALKNDATISHVPVSLYPDVRDRVPHLQRWRDGMRHLLQIFYDSPGFFYATGVTIFLLSWLLILLGMFIGPVIIGSVGVLGIHSMMFAMMGSIFGIIIWAMGLFLSVKIKTTIRLYNYLNQLPEDKLFWHSMAVLGICFGLFGVIVAYWAFKGFHLIAIEKQTLATIAFASNGVLIVSNLIMTHLLKRSYHN